MTLPLEPTLPPLGFNQLLCGELVQSMEKVTVELESLVPQEYDSFDEMLAYFNGGNGNQYKEDRLRVEEVVAEIQHILRVIAESRVDANTPA